MNIGAAGWAGRVEDPPLLRGKGRYTDDVRPEGTLFAAFVRAPVAFAELGAVDATAARAAPGVRLVLTGADLAAENLGSVTGPAPQTDRHGQPIRGVHRPVLATGRVRHVGEPVALVVADSLAAALDAAELISPSYDTLSPVTSVLDAVAQGAPEIWPEYPANVALDWVGPPDPDGTQAAAIAQAFAGAASIARAETPNQRLVVASMEPRAATASFDPASGRYTLRCGSQGASGIAMQVAGVLKIKPDQIRVLSDDVGGGFGMKASSYPEYPALLLAARMTGKPVHWVSTRSESFLADNQGRDNHWTAELAMDRDGRFLAIRVEGVANLGAYLTGVGAFANTGNLMACLPSVYDIPLIALHVRCVVTNLVPIGPYRGAGRPEINFLMEQLVEEAARVSGIDPVTLRRRNLIGPQAIPYQTAVGTLYDSGDFPRLLEAALTRADHAGFPARRAASEAAGRRRGIGVACYLENSGGMPQEAARIIFPGQGQVLVSVNPVAQGQGHQTVFGDLAASRLGVPRAAVRITSGDSARDVAGMGAVASRSTMMTGGAIAHVAGLVLEKARHAAALLLQAAPEDVVYQDGAFRAGGSALSLLEVAERAGELQRQGVIAETLDTTATLKAALSFPNGCHVAEVEIDPETGIPTVARYTAVDDCGLMLNPTLVAGQIHGGVAQGIGQALSEATVYDPDSGQLLAGSFMDYAMPRADMLPMIDSAHIELACTTNPIGAKGTGEAGATAAPSAIINAIRDALPGRPAIPMPATAEKIWRTMQG